MGRLSLRCLSLLLACVCGAASAQTATSPVTVQVDLAHHVGTYTPLYRWFGYDEANYTTTANGRALLRELHDLSPVPVYIRAHHLLTSGTGQPELKWSSTNVYTVDANGKPVYDFHILDGIFDAYKAAGVRPMVELGFMPRDLAATLPDKPGQPYQKHFPDDVLAGASNNPPKDYAQWQALVEAVVKHLVARYGREEVLTWYFEVWNEPDISYWHGTPQEYFHLYDASVAGVRAALPGARVGGPASTGPGLPRGSKPNADKAYALLKGFLEHVRDTRQPLDFISFHVKGRPTISDGQVTMGIDHELEDADRGFGLIASFPQFQHTPVILSEADPEGCAACSAKRNPANNYRNGTLYPAYTAAAYARLMELADHHGVNLIGTLTWAFEFEGADTFEGFRSLATNGIDKPVLNFFRMAAKMDGDRVAVQSSGAVPLDTIRDEGVRARTDVNALATVKGRRATVLGWNYADRVSADTPAAVQLAIGGFPTEARRVRVEEFRIDDHTSNAYTAWQVMGSPAHPTPEQTRELQATGQLHKFGAPRELRTSGGRLSWTETLPPESVSLWVLTW